MQNPMTADELREWADCLDNPGLHQPYGPNPTAAPALLEALKLYVKLDNDHRAGCKLSGRDWAWCYQSAQSALALAEGQPETPAQHEED